MPVTREKQMSCMRQNSQVIATTTTTLPYPHAILESCQVVGNIIENSSPKACQNRGKKHLHEKELSVAKDILAVAAKQNGNFRQDGSSFNRMWSLIGILHSCF
jgi:hypothetical protein